MAAIDRRLQLAVRELGSLAGTPGDWRAHAGRIVDRCRESLCRAGLQKHAFMLETCQGPVDPAVALQAILEVAAKVRKPGLLPNGTLTLDEGKSTL